ncbi:nucleotidyl transferase AbiEii/AbiGii toxin family protein [Sphingobium nicotianae]|uniref:Nucleotidyl transferase AbiEii/AbiGii toxin family protein n=1 Tax=Sphingobium nicotianae TaxID=2782607 RepID=A0A9X1ITC6_9SPHN|nr:nucleotidyl transferase AbiEii/AbiGii toxin family protein [Sphingobium nicotianae]MBT2189448.1 nucleotidyl transferase AbiEii/AbiGii toxin family protein [Sphingobium nicotianae]
MAKAPVNIAASVKQRLLNLARAEGRAYDVVLVRYALERLLYRLSISEHRGSFILKGGMLVTLWIESSSRETRDADFLGHGDSDPDYLREVFAGVLSIDADDGLAFDTASLRTAVIREEMEYGGVRLRADAYLERTRIPVTIDIGFGDALADAARTMAYPSMLGMDEPEIRIYPPASVIAEKFQAMVALGIANGRMKDYFDLWAIPRALEIAPDDLDAAIRATFERRGTSIPADRPPGLSDAMIGDDAKRTQWRAYAASLDLKELAFEEVVEAAWALVGPSCQRLSTTT